MTSSCSDRQLAVMGRGVLPLDPTLAPGLVVSSSVANIQRDTTLTVTSKLLDFDDCSFSTSDPKPSFTTAAAKL